MGDFYAVSRKNTGEFRLKFVSFNTEGEADWLFSRTFHENEDNFLNTRVKVAETTNFGELFVVIGVFNETPEAFMALVLGWSNGGDWFGGCRLGRSWASS